MKIQKKKIEINGNVRPEVMKIAEKNIQKHKKLLEELAKM